MMSYRIYPLGENALTVDFGNEISAELNRRVINLAGSLEKQNFKGFIECVPAYATVTIFYDVFTVRKTYGFQHSAFEFVRQIAEDLIVNLTEEEIAETGVIDIPVSFAEEFAPDLEHVARTNGLDESDVIEIFLSRTYRVFMVGFLPGFAYMGELDERIAAPRKETPRTRVQRGSVGIAGSQTGIYPLDSPGGWQIIGRTPEKLFDPQSENPTLLRAGNRVRFYRAD